VPQRQTAVRLSRARRVALRDALADQALTAASWRLLVVTIEDGLHRYWQHQRDDAGVRRVAWPRIQKNLRTVIAASRKVRERLPISPTSRQQDQVLVDELIQHEARWRHDLKEMTGRGRPPDAELSWCALGVVRALAQAGVPLTAGRKTAVVEVIGCVRQWATRKSRSSASWRSGDYEFSRRVVHAYRIESSRKRFERKPTDIALIEVCEYVRPDRSGCVDLTLRSDLYPAGDEEAATPPRTNPR
jgi:hypothetical protein